MGGYGSGRPRERDDVQDLPRLRVATVRPALEGETTRVAVRGWIGGGLRYSAEADPVPQPFGGKRWWFLCPSCGSRRGTLYHSGGRWACRTCLHLGYASQREGRLGSYWRQVARQKTVWLRLGGTEESYEDPTVTDWPPRPRGMHVATFTRLQTEYQRLHAAIEASGAASLAEGIRRLRRWL